MIAPSGMKPGSIALYTYYNYVTMCVFSIVVAFTVWKGRFKKNYKL